jgi:hypothetical protein
VSDPLSAPGPALAPGGAPPPAPAVGWGSPSALVLLAANLVPLYGVLALDWPVFPLLVLFWLENVAIGLINALRMLLANPAEVTLWAGKLVMVPFFCVHYGMFTLAHGVFVFALFGGKDYEALTKGFWPTDAASHAIAQNNLALPLAALAASHLFSFGWNYLWRGEFRDAEIGKLMAQPYGRVVVLHLTILLGGFAATTLGSPLWALLLLLALKIAIDLAAHLKEHAKLAPPPISAS